MTAEQASRDCFGRWRSGVSGNLSGRPPRSRMPRPCTHPPIARTGTVATVMPSTPGAELAKIGALAFGPGWQTALARELGVRRETVSRWATARFRLPDELAPHIRCLCLVRARQNVAAIRKVIKRGANQVSRIVSG